MDLLEGNTRRIIRHIANGEFENTERWVIGLEALVAAIDNDYPCKIPYMEKECERLGIFNNPYKRRHFHDMICWLYVGMMEKHDEWQKSKDA